MFCVLILLHTLIFCGNTVGQMIYNDLQPRMYVLNGHLILQAAHGKNITIKANSLYINDIDLLTTVEKAYNALKVEESFLHSVNNYDDRINNLEQKVLFGTETISNVTVSNNVNPNINRKINNLRRRLNRLQGLLTVNECNSNPCQNGGTCRDIFASFLCQCPSEWEGPLCDKDVNECTRFVGTDLGCQNGATCVNKPGSYECMCVPGYYGIHCTRKTESCDAGDAEICGHGTCIPQVANSGYKCICDQGWKNDGKKCTVDVNECEMNHPPCSTSPPVPCINTMGSFTCGSCPPGYTGNGYYCTDIDECAIMNGGCSLFPMVQCINTMGSRICGLCPPGYTGNGVQCVFKGVCNINNGGCNSLAQCRDNPSIGSTYVECICPAGYFGNGIGPNGCISSSTSLNPCESNPCKRGTCSVNNVTRDYVCNCPSRYKGRNCETLVNTCEGNPCQNGGSCINVLGLFYRCKCTSSFSGKNCENEVEACGGRLKTPEGTLKYPPDDFVNSGQVANCAWTIETNQTQVLNITFKSFNAKDTKGCRHEWLQIHDGVNSAAQMIGRFCGTKLPNNGTIISTHNVIFIWFRSDRAKNNGGFELTWTTNTAECEEMISTDSHGRIQSPGSPGNYPLNRDCSWYVVAPIKKRLLFHFYSLMIGDNEDCSHDYLEFYSGISVVDPVIAKFCNSTQPSPLYSPGHLVLIRFHSDNKDTYPGFQLTYSVVEGIPGCGGTYTSKQGEIHSPTIDGEYPPDLFCEYKIKRTLGSKVKLTFLSLNVEQSSGCLFDYVSIHEGPNAESPLIGRYCGTKIPAPYLSNGNEITIVFKTDWATANTGFRLKFEIACGGRYSEPSGVLSAPSYPDNYIEGSRCIYEIIQPPGHVIELEFTEFNLKDNSFPMCAFERVEIRDGDNENSTLIGKYCNETAPLIITQHNYLWMSYSSSFTYAGYAWRANYTTTNIGCGGILKEKVGTISSPSHPDGYPSQTTCTWIINAPPGQVIQLSWMTFQIEQSYNCAYDSISIFDNNTDIGMGGVMGKFCGNTLPPTLLSSSNVMTIKFTSDNSINLDGFLAAYAFIEEAQVCGGNYFTTAGVIKSPQYPDNYPTNKDCVWTINVPSKNQILLNITDFNIESYSNCRYDWLSIRNGGTSASPLIGTYCGTTIPKLIPSHTNKLYLHFNSDMTKTGHGFKITWTSTATGCGGTLSSPSGSIISPHYPEPYSRNTECMWKITVSAGSKIQLIFADIDLEKNVKCRLDYVEIFDGLTTNSKSLGKFCGPLDTAFIESTGNQVLVKFRSDISFQGRGFQLQYSTVCHNTLKGFHGVIESPNFPSNYPQSLDCVWDIEVTRMNKINISFSHFALESSVRNSAKNLCFDYVELKYKEIDINSGESEDYTNYAKYCGENRPEQITLNSNSVQVHFVSDDALAGIGFRLEWAIFGCGGILTAKEGIITSPNYPKHYPTFIICHWLIQVPYGQSVHITFRDVDIEKEETCMFDFIKIYNGIDETYNEIAKLCHQNKPIQITSSGNNMYVVFESDNSFEGKGFYANYTAVDTKCGGLMTSSSGSIFSPNYPQNYNKNDTCGWLIDVDDQHTIELEFEDLDIFDTKNCTYNYVKIFDGPSQAYPVLLTGCGNNKPNETVKSSYNQVYIEFRSQMYYTSKGFLIKYYKSCGSRIVTQGNGIIDFNSADTSERTSTCSWLIVASDPTDHVSLTVSNIGHIDYCDDEYSEQTLKIYNGETENAPLIGSYCNKVPPTIFSDGSALYIHLTMRADFFATYTVLNDQCGGTISDVTGYIASPNYPKTYISNIQCEWTIQVSIGNKMDLNFLYFNLPQSDNCNTDYLEIRKNSSSGKLLGVFCGTNMPLNITHDEGIWMMYKTSNYISDDSDEVKGFYAEYKSNEEITLFGSKGKISSPRYPKFFKRTSTYNWKITVAARKKILLTFKEFYFEIMSEDCSFADLTVYDGPTIDSPVLGKFCGLYIPDPIRSTTNTVFIQATLWSIRLGYLFLIEWLEVNEIAKYTKQVEGCGSKEVISLNEVENFTLTSPGYPFGYDHSLNCEWIFSTIPMNHLKISFENVNLNPNTYFNRHGLCFGDFVNVYQKGVYDNDWQLVKNVCHKNQTYDEGIQATNLMKIAFITNRYGNGTGFKAGIKEVCGGWLTEPYGHIIFENVTLVSVECQWNVTVRSGKTIKVTFLSFNVGGNNDGTCNRFIMLRNGILPNSPILGKGKYCGTTIPETLTTTGNSFSMKFSGYTKGTAFKLKYEEVSITCGGEVRLTSFDASVIISSPNYPNIPQPYSECNWIISAPPGEILRVDFEERFDLDSCSNEYVEIHEGGTELSPLIGQYCRNKAPDTLYSKDNMIFIKYWTNTEMPKNGFKANVSIEDCGGTLRGTEGELAYSPKTGTGKNKNCTWIIQAPVNYNVKVKFVELNIGYYRVNCTNVNRIIVSEFSELNDTENILGSYCGRTLPKEITSSSNKMFIKFVINFTRLPIITFKIKFEAIKEDCGGTINADAGTIQSPGYPQMSHELRDCHWSIEVPKGRRITLNIVDLDLDSTAMLHEQGLAVFNGKSITSKIMIFKPGDSKSVVESSDNLMTVFFWSTYTTEHRGFKATFTSDKPTVCVGDFNKTSGVIQNPNVNYYSCLWTHVSERNETTALTITLNSNFTRSPCLISYAMLNVYYEKNSIAKLCHTSDKPHVIRSPYPVTNVVAGTIGTYSLHFTINYNTYKCGGILNGETGSISSPGFPISGKQSTVECAWLIKVASEQAVEIVINTLNLGSDCEKHHLIVYNGDGPSHPRIGKYCNNNKPDVIKTATRNAWVEYKYESGSSGTGFNLTYEPLIEGCGGIFHDDTRIIQTPGYSDHKKYQDNTECIWEVRSKTGYFIRLKFIDRFFIEETDGCQDDYVEIWDFKDDTWTSMGRKCGREAPQEIHSTGDKMKIVFRSGNNKITAAGFKAEWDLQCGGTFLTTNKPQIIRSPGYPDVYGNELKCVYNITNPQKVINIDFLDFELETGTPECKYDNFTIKGAYSHSAATYCGVDKPGSIRLKDFITITFQTDKWFTRRGFKFSFKNEVCGEIITTETTLTLPEILLSSTQTSLSGVQEYYTCKWEVKAPNNLIPILRINQLNLPQRRFCLLHNLRVYKSVNATDSNKIATLCGRLSEQPVVQSPTSEMYIILTISVPYSVNAFQGIVYFTHGPQEGCGGKIDLQNTKSIQPPNFSDLDCQWFIEAPYDNVIKIQFNEINLSDSYKNNSCFYSYIEIRDGGSTLSNLIDKLCSNSNSQNSKRIIVTTGRFASVRYITKERRDNAFKITLKPTTTKCGSSLLNVTNHVQILSSPNYPSSYPEEVTCVWLLKAPSLQDKIFLHFNEFDLLEENGAHINDNSCKKDKLVISDDTNRNVIDEGLGPNAVYGGSSSYIMSYNALTGRHEFCGKNDKIFDYFSPSDTLTIFFTSGLSSKRGKGFMLEYLIAGCSRNFSSIQGRIQGSQRNESCTYIIHVPENRTISLYFKQFLIGVSDNCAAGGLEVRDGDSATSPEIMKSCGYRIPNPVFSSTNKLWLRNWNSRSYISHVASFDATYTSSTEGRGCGGEIYNYKGKVTSPLYPNEYKENKLCVWDVRVPLTLKLAFKFKTFDINDDCDKTYVEVQTFLKGEASLHKYCSNDDPSILYSDNRVVVKYQGSLTNTGTGWEAIFEGVTDDTKMIY